MTGELPRAELLRTERLTRHFKIGSALSRRTLHAVDDVSFAIGEREIVALAGESGSGKSTIARLLATLYRPTSGQIARAPVAEPAGVEPDVLIFRNRELAFGLLDIIAIKPVIDAHLQR